MVLMALVTGFVALYFAGSITRSKVSESRRDISATIRHARALAIERGEAQTVVFDLDSHTFGIGQKPRKSIPSDIVIAISDPVRGEITHGTYDIDLQPTGEVHGGSILLSKGTSKAVISPDPVMGVK
jgi:hypothetical protein